MPSNFPSDANLSSCTLGHIYSDAEFTSTVATDFDLVCEGENKALFLGTVMMAGIMIGSALGGLVGDRLGRKRTMLVALLVVGPTLILGAFASSYEVYALLQLIYCSVLPMIWMSSHSILLECFSAGSRIAVVCIKDMYWPLELMALSLVGYLCQDWKQLHLVSGGICLCCLLSIVAVPESLRWLAQNGKKKDAFKVLQNVARSNGRSLNKEDLSRMDQVLTTIEVKAGHKREINLSPLSMFRKGYVRTTLIFFLTWATTNVAAYTLSLNATRLSGNLFLNFCLSAFCEIPGSCLLYLALTRTGRKNNMCAFLLVVAACCLALAVIPKVYTNVILVVFLVGKCFVGAAFQLIWLITSEVSTMQCTNLIHHPFECLQNAGAAGDGHSAEVECFACSIPCNESKNVFKAVLSLFQWESICQPFLRQRLF